MARQALHKKDRLFVLTRANYRCEYCCTSEIYLEPLTIDHVIPIAHEGEHHTDNLAAACGRCNLNKHARTHAIDPITQDLVALFNPRIQKWDDYFIWNETGTHILGITQVGRATVETLQLNRSHLVNLRRLLVSIGEHPPIKSD